jgi:class 3 adenylate cyclase
VTSPPLPQQDLHAWLETATAERFLVAESAGIGRSEDNPIRLPGEKVSRHHALIQSRDRQVHWLTDLGSSNGTFLNGRRVTEPTRLYDQDRISIGPWEVIFRQPGTRPRPAADLSISQGTLSLHDPRSISCWMLVLDLGSLADLAAQMPADELARLTATVSDAAAQIVRSRGGTLNRYLGNGFLASWQGGASMAHAVASALRDLQQLRTGSRLQFRFVLHQGEVTAGTGVSADEKKIVGPEAGFVFRVDKLAASLHLPSLVSEAAAKLLQGHLPLADAGRHTLSGYPEGFPFFRMP